MQQKLVVRYADGRIARGQTTNFWPTSSSFLLAELDAPQGVKPIEVELAQLKAVFFVRDFWGNPRYEEKKCFSPEQPYEGWKVKVTFTDGEVIVGSTGQYDPKEVGFFIFPADTRCNTIKIFAVNTSVRSVEKAQEVAVSER